MSLSDCADQNYVIPIYLFSFFDFCKYCIWFWQNFSGKKQSPNPMEENRDPWRKKWTFPLIKTRRKRMQKARLQISKAENHALIDCIWVKMYFFKYAKYIKNISVLTIFAWFNDFSQNLKIFFISSSYRWVIASSTLKENVEKTPALNVYRYTSKNPILKTRKPNVKTGW